MGAPIVPFSHPVPPAATLDHAISTNKLIVTYDDS